jgi:hypothetical protein
LLQPAQITDKIRRKPRNHNFRNRFITLET